MIPETGSSKSWMDLSALPDANPDPVLVFVENASLVYANPAAEKLLTGLSLGDALGIKTPE